MKLTLIEFPSRMFTYTKEDKTLIAEVSDMGNRHLQQIYDDACDCGFAVRSDVTGNVVVFCMERVEYSNDEDNEIVAWLYTPATESIVKYPECRGMKATIFND